MLAFLCWDSSRRGLGSVSVCSATRMPPDEGGVVNPIYMPGTARSGGGDHVATHAIPAQRYVHVRRLFFVNALITSAVAAAHDLRAEPIEDVEPMRQAVSGFFAGRSI